jgi:ADP-ribose pyrophosphatase
VFVEEFRPPINKQTIEFPAGIAGDIQGSESESLEEAARRELWEETGYRAETLKQVFLGPSSAGLTDEMCAMFVALDAVRAGEGGGDESERINVHHVPLDRVDAFLKEKQAEGCAVGARVYAGLYFLHRELAS